jgi:o-succinylbenzoate---CoA ligase
MPRLVAIDQPGGPAFVERLQRIWDAGDAAFPVDQRLPPDSRRRVEAEMHVGEEVESGDALVVATSGSTGRPKGVVLTHTAIAASARATSIRLGVTTDDHWLACLPLSHVGGLSVVTRSLLLGTALTVMPTFDADEVKASDATMVSLVATALARIDAARFRVILLGGSRAPIDRPPNCVTTYGMTETGSGVVYDGTPLDGVEIDVDPHGEIHVRCDMLMRCYRDGDSPITDEGWFATGDLGRWLDDGRLHVDGRRGDLIITGGENVWPEVVEAVLRTHPGVADVIVRGVDDAEWGNIVEAVVVPAAVVPTLVDLRNHVKLSHPAFMAPRSLVLAERLARTSLGKLRRGTSAIEDQPIEPAEPATPAPPSIT